jgi:hypothetical protein
MYHRKEHHPFKSLQSPATWKRYSHTWAAVLAFTIRMTQRHKELRAHPVAGDPPFTAFITGEQAKWAMKVKDSLAATPGSCNLTESIHKLSLACFAPKSTQHMGDGAFKDVVNTYIVLSNLIADGSFQEPTLIAPKLSDVQYLIRSVVFVQIRQLNKETQESMER